MSAQHPRRHPAWLGALLILSTPALAAEVSAQEAAATYSHRCAGCHGDDGTGPKLQRPGSPIPDLRAPAWQRAHGEAQVIQIIADGVPGKHMPSFKSRLGAEEIAALARLVKSLGQPAAAPAPR